MQPVSDMSTSCLQWLQLKHGDLKVSSTQPIYTALCKDQMAACVTTENPREEFLINHFYLKCLSLDQTSNVRLLNYPSYTICSLLSTLLLLRET